MKIALVVGHKEASPGASNKTYLITEYNFNLQLVNDIISQYTGNNTLIKILRTTYRTLPFNINDQNPKFAISFHANAYNTKVSGTEVLYYHKSINGKLIAEILQKNICEALSLRNRGIKPKTVEDRGGYILKHTYCPIVIVEPFFIDNDHDCDVIFERIDALVQAFIKSINTVCFMLGES